MLKVYLAVIQCFRQLHLLAAAGLDMTQAQAVQTVPPAALVVAARHLVVWAALALLGKVLLGVTQFNPERLALAVAAEHLLLVPMEHQVSAAMVVLVQHQTFLVLASPAQAAVVAGYT
jgi:hypothetical protein